VRVLKRTTKFFISLYLLWLIPSIGIIIAYLLYFQDVFVGYVLAGITIYALVWLRLADAIIVRYAIPRSEKYAEIIAEMYGLRKVDPRLAYFLYHWLSPILKGKKDERSVKRIPSKLKMKKVIIPAEEGRARRKVKRRKSLREIYEEAARLGREILAEESRESEPRAPSPESVEAPREGEIREAREEGSGISGDVLDSIDVLSIIFSQKGVCFLKAIISMPSREFSGRFLARECSSHPRTVRNWINAALRLGIIEKVDEGKYIANREKIENLLKMFLPSGEGGG